MPATGLSRRACTAVLCAALTTCLGGGASAQSFPNVPLYDSAVAVERQAAPTLAPVNASSGDELPSPLRRQIVPYDGDQPPGTIIIDTAHTFLYLTLGGGTALRYGIGVGRKGFTWSGVETISRKSEWPDWIPPAEMISRQPYLPRWVGGGPGNPLGARALYLGNTDYRIHGTNNPNSIGKHVSSGCIRMRDADVIDLYDRVGLGTKVVVLPNDPQAMPPSDRGEVAVKGAPGAMIARVSVRPGVAAAARAAARSDWSTNPTTFGLY